MFHFWLFYFCQEYAAIIIYNSPAVGNLITCLGIGKQGWHIQIFEFRGLFSVPRFGGRQTLRILDKIQWSNVVWFLFY